MCETCGWKDALEEAEDMIDDPDYDFASDTLEGMSEWISENEHVTPAQWKALTNILNSLGKGRE